MTTNQDSPNTAGAAEPVAWMYTSPHGDKELILNYGCEYAKRLRKSRWTETPLYVHPPQRPSVVMTNNTVHGGQWLDLRKAQIARFHGLDPNIDLVPDEVVEADKAYVEWSEKRGVWPRVFRDEAFKAGWDAALTASLPAIRAQAVAEIAADIRATMCDCSGKFIADELEQGAHDND